MKNINGRLKNRFFALILIVPTYQFAMTPDNINHLKEEVAIIGMKLRKFLAQAEFFNRENNPDLPISSLLKQKDLIKKMHLLKKKFDINTIAECRDHGNKLLVNYTRLKSRGFVQRISHY